MDLTIFDKRILCFNIGDQFYRFKLCEKYPNPEFSGPYFPPFRLNTMTVP